MSNIPFHKTPSLGLNKYGNVGNYKAHRLGVASNVPEVLYEDNFTFSDTVKVKRLIKHLNDPYFENNKFSALNYLVSPSFSKKYKVETIEKTLVKKDNLRVAKNNIYLKPLLKSEESPQDIDDLHYIALAKELSLNRTVSYIDNIALRNGYKIQFDKENNSINL